MNTTTTTTTTPTTTTTTRKKRRTNPGRLAERRLTKIVDQLLASDATCNEIGGVLDCIDDLCKRIERRQNEEGTQP